MSAVVRPLTPRLPSPSSAPREAGNRLLAVLPESDYLRLLPELKPVRLESQEVLYEEGEPLDYVYFPVNAVVSLMSVLEDGATVEVAMVGRRGLVGIQAILGAQTAAHWTVTQVAGEAWRMRARTLVEFCRTSETLSRLLARYCRALLTQYAQRAVCNCRHSVLQRLSTWLLMMADSTGGDCDLPLTQDLISRRLGSRRATITVAINQLEDLRVVRSQRGQIRVLDRVRLEEFACECYATMTADLESVCLDN